MKTLSDVISDRVNIRINLYKSGETLDHGQPHSIPKNRLTRQCNKIIQLFNRNTITFHESKDEVLERLGKELCNELLPSDIQLQLSSSKAEHLILKLDPELLQIPWESLIIDNIPLGERFSVGRIIKTGQSADRRETPDHEKQEFRMQIIANPSGDLAEATQEGLLLCDDMDMLKSNQFNIDSYLETQVSSSDIVTYLQNSEIIHFAGHADYKSRHPEECGWKLKETFFTARDINKMETGMKMPLLVVSNACNSAITNQWEWDKKQNPNNPMSLPGAFIRKGVRHYVGTSWQIQDNSGILFSQSFYPALFSGLSIGKALQLTRKEMREKGAPICCASYILIGNPEICYVQNNRPYLHYPEQSATHENVITLSIQVESFDEPIILRHARQIMRSAQPVIENPRWMIVIIFSILLMSSVIIWKISDKIVQEGDSRQKKIDECIKEYWDTEEKIDEYLQKFAKIRNKEKTVIQEENEPLTSKSLNIGVSLSKKMICEQNDRAKALAYAIEQNIKDRFWIGTIDRMEPENFLHLIKTIYRSHFYAKKPLPADIVPPDFSLRVELLYDDQKEYLVMHYLEMTGHIKRFSEPLQPGGVMPQAPVLANNLIQWMQEKFPLRGIIIHVSASQATLNIGSIHHIERGQKFQTVEGKSLMSVNVVADYTCGVEILSHASSVSKGMRVEAIFK
jgi:CHAT domain-containing protein